MSHPSGTRKVRQVKSLVDLMIRKEGVPWVKYERLRKEARMRLQLTKRDLDRALRILVEEELLDSQELTNILHTKFIFPTKLLGRI